jgi:hypothetical protein
MRNRSLLPTSELVARYLADEPMASIAAAAGISRTGVWKHLRRAGVATDRTAPPIGTTCFHCGTPFVRHRWQVRQATHSFCSTACYSQHMRNQGVGYSQHRAGQRHARKVVAAYYALPLGAVVHHHDKDNDNNDIRNLAVFSSHASHMSYHRGGKGAHIWDGRTVQAQSAS